MLDIVTKSGTMVIAEAELHVLVAATHCFEKSLMGTLVQESRNPIEELEQSALVMGSVVHATAPVELVQRGHRERIAARHAKESSAIDDVL